MDDRLRGLQLCELEILNEFVRICEKHGLRYYLVGGTLLGAVRHKGFIPWDDDIDVAMLREDYDRFAQVCASELDGKFFYQSPETDPHYFLTYAKLRKNGTQVCEERFRDAEFHKGVSIDIFPQDDCPKPGLICHFLYNVLAVMNRRGEMDSAAIVEPYTEVSGKIGLALLRPFSPGGIVKLRRRIIRLAKWLSDGKHVASFSGAYGYGKEVALREWYREIKLPFEGREYVCPAGYHELLRRPYGEDYMRLPSEEKRKTHIHFD